jgi:hypothetical protein
VLDKGVPSVFPDHLWAKVDAAIPPEPPAHEAAPRPGDSHAEVKRRLNEMSPQLKERMAQELDALPKTLTRLQFMQEILASMAKYNQLAKEEQASLKFKHAKAQPASRSISFPNVPGVMVSPSFAQLLSPEILAALDDGTYVPNTTRLDKPRFELPEAPDSTPLPPKSKTP